MANKNFIIKQRTSSGYDVLYPKTSAEQVIIDQATGATVATHLADMAKHNQFMHEGVLHQIAFGYNPTLGCFTYSIREVV